MTDSSPPNIPAPPHAGLGRDVARSSVWSLAGQATVLLVSFVATPFTVRLLGPEGYGLVALVNALIGYVTVVDLGMGSASTRFASEAFARGDADGEAAAVWTASAVTLVPSTLVALVLWVTAPQIAERVLHIGPELQGSAVLALRLGAVALVGRIVAAVLNTPELVRLRWDLYVFITNGTGVAQVVAVPLVVAAGGGPGAAVGTVAAASVLAALLHAAVGTRLAPAMRRPSVRRSLVGPLSRFGGGLVGANVLGMLLGSGERLILAALKPIRAVGHYSVASNLSQVMGVVPIAVCQPLFPAFARLETTGDAEQSARLYRRALTTILAGVLPMAVACWVVAGPFLDVWAGKEYGDASLVPLRVLLVGVLVNSCGVVPYHFLLGVGASRVILRCHLLELPLYPLYALALISRFGATGAAVVWTLRLVLVTGFLFVAAARHGGPSTAPFGNVAARLGPGVAVLAVPLLVELAVDSFAIRVLALALALPVFAVLAWRRALDPDDRTQLVRLVRRRG